MKGPFDNFRRIKFKVTDAPLNMQHMVVTYDNGQPDKIDVRQNIPQGGESRVIDLQGRRSAQHPPDRLLVRHQGLPEGQGRRDCFRDEVRRPAPWDRTRLRAATLVRRLDSSRGRLRRLVLSERSDQCQPGRRDRRQAGKDKHVPGRVPGRRTAARARRTGLPDLRSPRRPPPGGDAHGGHRQLANALVAVLIPVAVVRSPPAPR